MLVRYCRRRGLSLKVDGTGFKIDRKLKASEVWTMDTPDTYATGAGRRFIDGWVEPANVNKKRWTASTGAIGFCCLAHSSYLHPEMVTLPNHFTQPSKQGQ